MKKTPVSAHKFESSRTHARKAVDDLVGAGTAKVNEIKLAAVDQTEEFIDAARRTTDTWVEEATTYARQNPVRALATAFGVGFLVGVISRR